MTEKLINSNRESKIKNEICEVLSGAVHLGIHRGELDVAIRT